MVQYSQAPTVAPAHSFVTWRGRLRSPDADSEAAPVLRARVRAPIGTRGSTKIRVRVLRFMRWFSFCWRSRKRRPKRVKGTPPGAMLWAPIQPIEEDSDGLASQRHGAARRLESRRPDCAQPASATRLRGAPTRCRETASE